MGTHFEGGGADSSIDWVRPRGEVGEEVLAAGKYAIVVDYGDIFYVQGTPAQLRGFSARISAAVQEIGEHAAGPLLMSDIEPDEDHIFTCPRCDATFEVGEYADFEAMYSTIREHIAMHNDKAAG